MADYKVTDTELTSIANAIRTKGGTQAQLEFPTGFVSAVQAIPTGGGGGNKLIAHRLIAYGNSDAADNSRYQFTLDDHSGWYGLLVITRRKSITVDGWTLLHEINTESDQYVSIYTKQLASNSESVSIVGNGSGRLAVTAWALDNPVTVSYKETATCSSMISKEYNINGMNDRTDLYAAQIVVKNNALLVFDAYNQTQSELKEYAVPNTINNFHQCGYSNPHRVRGFSCIVFESSDNTIPTIIGVQAVSNYYPQNLPSGVNGRVLVYTLTEAS